MKEPIEIVKRIPSPKDEPKEEPKEDCTENHAPVVTYKDDIFNEIEEEQKKKPPKKILLTLFGLTVAGAIGYVGMNGSKEEPPITPSIHKVPTKTEVNNSKLETEVIKHLEEKNNYYVESLAVSKEPEPTPIPPPPIPKEEEKNSLETPVVKTLEPVITAITPSIPKEVEKATREEIEKEKEIVEKIRVIEEKKALEEERVKKEKRRIAEGKRRKREAEKIAQRKAKKEANHIIRYERIKPRIRTVQSGDTLASIAKRFYGNPMDFRRIVRANPRIRSSRTALHLGEKIIIPRKDNKKRRRFIIVKRGNTLASISKNVYGNTDQISKIVNANYRIKTKHSLLRLGQKVYVPR